MSLWAVLVPILLVDVLNPVLLAAVIYALGSQRAMANAVAMLLGHTACYFAAGIGLALGIEALTERLKNPEPIDFSIEIVLGMLLLAVGFAMAQGGGGKADFGEAARLSPGSSFAMGAVINLIGLPFAAPYFGAVGQILKADLSATAAVSVLAIYNLLYAAPFAAVVATRAIGGDRAAGPLRKLSSSIDRVGAVLGPGLLLLLGAAFVLDAAAFFLRGRPLFAF